MLTRLHSFYLIVSEYFCYNPVMLKHPNKKRVEEIAKLPSTWDDIDFSTFQDNEKLYWFEERRIESWLLNDTKKIKQKADSMFGLVAMVCIGVEFLSKFRYGNGNSNSNIDFPNFLEEYIDRGFKKEINNPYKPIPPATNREKWFYSKPKIKYSEIFYFGMRNQLMHKFCFVHSVLIEPIPRFLMWEKKKKRLLVDSRLLEIYFENGVRKYISQVWKSSPGSPIYDSFFEMFSENFERKF